MKRYILLLTGLTCAMFIHSQSYDFETWEYHSENSNELDTFWCSFLDGNNIKIEQIGSYLDDHTLRIPSTVINKSGDMQTYTVVELGDDFFHKAMDWDTGEEDIDYMSSNVEKAILPGTLLKIGQSFNTCSVLNTVECNAITPPVLQTGAFTGIPSTAVLKVPCGTVEDYESAGYAAHFASIETIFPNYMLPMDPIEVYDSIYWPSKNAYITESCVMYDSLVTVDECDSILVYTITILHKPTAVENVTAHSADIKWIPDPEVVEYTITIYAGATPIRQHIVDGEGNLLTAQSAPMAICPIRKDTTVASEDYYVLTLDDLDEATDYTYTIEGKNASQVKVYQETGSFTTEEEPDDQGLMDANATEPKRTRKIIRDGQLFILQDGVIYTVQGTRHREK